MQRNLKALAFFGLTLPASSEDVERVVNACGKPLSPETYTPENGLAVTCILNVNNVEYRVIMCDDNVVVSRKLAEPKQMLKDVFVSAYLFNYNAAKAEAKRQGVGLSLAGIGLYAIGLFKQDYNAVTNAATQNGLSVTSAWFNTDVQNLLNQAGYSNNEPIRVVGAAHANDTMFSFSGWIMAQQTHTFKGETTDFLFLIKGHAAIVARNCNNSYEPKFIDTRIMYCSDATLSETLAILVRSYEKRI